jgi:adenylylsulfate kinase
MGLPGSGKTTFAKELILRLWEEGRTVTWLNADKVRKTYNDWDFSEEGRIRQSLRMKELADKSTNDYVICDFVAPLLEMRNNFNADFTIWIDTIKKGRYEDTNRIFVEPDYFNVRVTEQNAKKWSKIVLEQICMTHQ